ncbi:MAG: GNAT family N-acetyltransferase [Blastocatellia bacterium]
MNHIIRPTTREDEPFLWEMLYQALYLPEGHPPFPREIVQAPEIGRYVQRWGLPDDAGAIAVDDDGAPIGAVWIRLLTAENRGYGFVDDQTPELSIAILPAFRGMGIGERLMRRLFEMVKDRHAAISLSVSVDNPAARLYRRLGFDTVRVEGASLTMRKNLLEDQ